MRLHFTWLVLVLLCLALVNCRQTPAPLGPELTLNLGAEPPTLDPLLATDPPTIQVDQLLFANLVLLNPDNGAPQPGLAREWLVSPDGLIWEFRLREDAFWVRFNRAANQVERVRRINAQDVVYSVHRLFDPRTGSSFGVNFAPLIRNAQPLVTADPRTAPEDLDRLSGALGISAKGDFSVQFQLTRPLAAFPTLVGAWLGRVVPREPIEEKQVDWTDVANLWSSGPYVLQDREPNIQLVLRRNPLYYEADSVQLESLRFRLIPDPASALDEYLSGALDTTDPYDTIEGENYQRVQADPALSRDLKLLPGLCTQYIGFNTSKPPFDKVQVRLAFAEALNRDALVSDVFPLGEPARWFTPPPVNAAPDPRADIGIDLNAPLAKTTLDQALAGAPLPPLTFGVNTNDVFIASAVAAIQNWRASLAAQITVEDTPWETFLDQVRVDPPPLFRMGYCGSYPDAANFAYDVFHSGSPFNFTRWSSKQYDQLLDQAARETDVLRRRQLYARAEKLLVEDQAVIIPLLWTQRASLTRARVQRSYAIAEGYDRIEQWRIK